MTSYEKTRKKEKENNDFYEKPDHRDSRNKTPTLLLQGLDLLIAHAAGAELGTATKILYTAKEELVHWMVNMNFHETDEEKFINRHLYDSSPFILGEVIARIGNIKDSSTRDALMNSLGIDRFAHSFIKNKK